MISWSSIWAIVVRHIRVWQRDPNVFLFGLYWPVLDIMVWGFLGRWIQQAHSTQFYNYEAAALLGILLWQVVGRGCNIMLIAFTEELWAHNVVNLFSLPLRITEWMAGVVLYYALMIFITTTVCMFVIVMLYDISFWPLLKAFLIFLPPLFFSGIWLGFTGLQIIITMGKRGVELGYVIVWFLLPFSGAYYPLEVLPGWGQTLSSFLPMSSVFQGMRRYVMYNQDFTTYLIKGYVLSIIYAICASLLFIYCFNRSRKKGLARLVD